MNDLKRAFGSPDAQFHERVRQTLFRIEEKEEAIVKRKLTLSMDNLCRFDDAWFILESYQPN